MKILLTGGTGLIGNALQKQLVRKGYQVNILSRRENLAHNQYYWDYTQSKINEKALHGVQILVHLAGATIAKRWTNSYKKEILDSRTQSLDFLGNVIRSKNIEIRQLISASGINYYGTHMPEKIYTEKDNAGTDFLADVCVKWEKAALNWKDITSAISIVRTPVVLTPQGGALVRMLPAFSKNIGAVLGNGKQYMPWVSLLDIASLYTFIIENQYDGIYNATVSESLTNKKFTYQLAKALHKKVFPFPIPKWVLQLALGEMSSILLEGNRASSEKIRSEGFKFEQKTIESLFNTK